MSKDAITIYLDQINRAPLLTRDEEIELAKRVENGDQLARDMLIESNLRFVVAVAKRYGGPLSPLQLLDFIQEGNLALFKTVKKFDWRKGFRFYVYAKHWIRHFIQNALSEQGKTIRIPLYMLRVISTYEKVEKDLSSELGRKPFLKEIVLRMGLKEKYVCCIKKSIIKTISFESIFREDFEKLTIPGFEINENIPQREILKEALDKLESRERDIILMRFGLEQDGLEHTFKEIAEVIGLTRQRVEQIYAEALEKLKVDDRVKKLE